MSEVTIFHNPDCGTSRNTLALIHHAGIEPRAVEFLKPPPTREQVRLLLAEMKMPVRQLLPVPKLPPFRTEDGELIEDSGVRRA